MPIPLHSFSVAGRTTPTTLTIQSCSHVTLSWLNSITLKRLYPSASPATILTPTTHPYNQIHLSGPSTWEITCLTTGDLFTISHYQETESPPLHHVLHSIARNTHYITLELLPWLRKH